MTEPRLPDGDDPFEILGVRPDADEAALRRAYGERIRIFRPDRRPAEFARVREAYERALLRRAVDEVYRDGASHEATAAPRGRPAVDAVAEAWRLVAEGGLAAVPAARDRLAAAVAEGAAAEPRMVVHAFLLDDLVAPEGESAPTAGLERALAEGAPIAEWVVQVLNPTELRRIARRPAASWENLRRQPRRESAASLFRIRCEEAVFGDDVAGVAAEIADPFFRTDALDDPDLVIAAQGVVSALAWSDPEQARALAARFEGGPDVPVLRYGIAAAQELGPQLAELPEELSPPPALDRLLRLAPGAGDRAEELMAEFRAELRRDPKALLTLLTRWERWAPGLYAHLHQFTEGWLEPAAPSGGRERLNALLSEWAAVVRRHGYPAGLWIRFAIQILSFGLPLQFGWPGFVGTAAVHGLGWLFAQRWFRFQWPRMRVDFATALVRHPAPLEAAAEEALAARRRYGFLHHFAPLCSEDPLLWLAWRHGRGGGGPAG